MEEIKYTLCQNVDIRGWSHVCPISSLKLGGGGY